MVEAVVAMEVDTVRASVGHLEWNAADSIDRLGFVHAFLGHLAAAGGEEWDEPPLALQMP